MFRFIGQVIMFAGAGHILFAIYVWLKKGIWTTISLGDWGITIFKLNDLGRIDTGWWAINKVLNYIILCRVLKKLRKIVVIFIIAYLVTPKQNIEILRIH